MADEPKEIEIEAFRAGAPAAVRAGVTEAVLDEVIANYDPERDHAPLVFGHPESDGPAKGVISGLRRSGATLFVKVKEVAQDAIDGVRNGQFLKPSTAFWHPTHPSNPTPGKWNFRHQALLGAASPGIPGLPRLKFDATETVIIVDEPGACVVSRDPATDAVAFAVAEVVASGVADIGTIVQSILKQESKVAEPTLEEREQALADREKALKSRETEFAANAAKARADANVAMVDGWLKAGKILPPHVAPLVAAFNALPDEDFEFSAEDKQPIGTKLAAIFEAAKPQIIFEAITPRGDPVKPESADGIALKARQLVADKKAPTFEAAVYMLEKGA